MLLKRPIYPLVLYITKLLIAFTRKVISQVLPSRKPLTLRRQKMLVIRLLDGYLPILLASLGITNSLRIL